MDSAKSAIWSVLGWGCLADLLRVVTATVNRSGMPPSTEARVSGLTGAVTYPAARVCLDAPQIAPSPLSGGIPTRSLMELNGWTSPQMLRRYGASARSARARRSYDRIMDGSP